MTVLALANLGTHDLKSRDGKYHLPGKLSDLTKQPEQWADYSLPILVPFLQAVKEKTRQVPKLLLFVSWQKDVPEALHKKDTKPLGELVRCWLEPGGRPDYQGLASQVILSPPIVREPHNYDLMLEWFGQELPGCIHASIESSSISLSSPPSLHISVTAGTPAMNTALLFKAFGLGVGRVDAVWHVSEHGLKAHPLNIGRVLAGEPLRRTFRAHLDRFDYEAAGELAQYVAHKWVQRLVKALADIRRSDFDGVLKSLSKGDQWQSLRDWVKLLSDGRRELEKAVNRVAKINEGVRAIHAYQISEMAIQFKRKDYPEALTALYRLQESLVRIAFEQVTAIAGIIRPGVKDHENWVIRLQDFFSERGLTRDFELKNTREVQGKIVQLAEPDHPVSKWLNRLYQEDIGARNLASLRNKCRVAHGFCAVSDRDLKSAGWPGGADEIVKTATDVAEALLGKLPEPPDQAFHDRILTKLL